MGALVWFIAAVALAIGELLAGEFTMLMLAGAALATAGVSIIGIPLWAEILCFALSAFLLLAFLKPYLHRHLSKKPVLDTSTKALEGQSAVVIEEISEAGGQVRLDGSIWSARSMVPATTFATGERVNVVSIDGATAVVWKEP